MLLFCVLLLVIGGSNTEELSGAVESEIFNPEPPHNETIPECNMETEDGHKLIEGDILEPKEAKKGGDLRSAVVDVNLKWRKENGVVVVPYVLDSSTSSRAADAVRQAAADYAARTCIRLQPRTFQRDYVLVKSSNGCYSSWGKTGGAQTLSLGTGCERKGVALHEFMHALGFLHEQARPDRDTYVDILWQNMNPGTDAQFNKCSRSECTTMGLPYDYASIMHYAAGSFAREYNLETIKPRKAGVEIGQRRGLSELDIKKINKLYDCDQGNVGVSVSVGGNSISTGTKPIVITHPQPRPTSCKYEGNCASCANQCHQLDWRNFCQTECACCIPSTAATGFCSNQGECADCASKCHLADWQGYCQRRCGCCYDSKVGGQVSGHGGHSTATCSRVGHCSKCQTQCHSAVWRQYCQRGCGTGCCE